MTMGVGKCKVSDCSICADCDKKIFEITKYKRVGLFQVIEREILFTVMEIYKIINGEILVFLNIDVYNCTSDTGKKYIVFDNFHRILFKRGDFISTVAINYSNIWSYELTEDEKLYGGFGMAAAGGILFGGAGAVVGALAAGDPTRKINKMIISVFYKDQHGSVSKYLLPIIDVRGSYALKVESLEYKTYRENAQIIMHLLDDIIKAMVRRSVIFCKIHLLLSLFVESTVLSESQK